MQFFYHQFLSKHSKNITKSRIRPNIFNLNSKKKGLNKALLLTPLTSSPIIPFHSPLLFLDPNLPSPTSFHILPRVSLALLSDMPLHYSSRSRSRSRYRYHRYDPTVLTLNPCLVTAQAAALYSCSLYH